MIFNRVPRPALLTAPLILFLALAFAVLLAPTVNVDLWPGLLIMFIVASSWAFGYLMGLAMPWGKPGVGVALGDRFYAPWFLVGTGSVAGFAVVISLIGTYGSEGLLSISNVVSRARYGGDWSLPWFVSLINSYLYACTLIGGVLYFDYIKKSFLRRSFALLPLIMLVFQGFLLGTKATIVTALFVFFIAYSVWSAYSRRSLLNRYAFRSVLFWGVVLFLSLFITQVARSGWSVDFASTISKIFYSYFLLPFYAGAKWLSENEVQVLSFGSSTFDGLIPNAPRGHGEFVTMDVGFEVLSTNVYTVFRPLISDFGLIGAVAFGLFGSLLLGYALRKVAIGRIGFISLYYVISMFFLWGLFGSFFSYTVNVVSFLWIAGYLFVSHLLSGRRVISGIVGRDGP